MASSGPTASRHGATESSRVTSSACVWMPSNPLTADLSVATTECPRLASTCAVAIPMPRAAPVIKTLSAVDIRKSLSRSHFSTYRISPNIANESRIADPRPLRLDRNRHDDGRRIVGAFDQLDLLDDGIRSLGRNTEVPQLLAAQPECELRFRDIMQPNVIRKVYAVHQGELFCLRIFIYEPYGHAHAAVLLRCHSAPATDAAQKMNRLRGGV